MTTSVLRNRYRVLRRLGSGGVGSVYMVEELHASNGTRPPLALKALFTDEAHRELLSSLRLEFRVLATLRHPLIARVYDFGSIPPDSGLEGSEGRPGFFFTRDLIAGKDLETHCQGLSVAEICRACQQTAEVLDVLHRSGMIHGDFKPANVIVADDGRPHLIDFGLVRTEGQSSAASGTAAYLSPELLRGQVLDRRADLYAMGISIYQLVTGTLPMPTANMAELIAWHLDGEPLRIPAERSVPEELNEVVLRLTNRDPDRRYPSAAETALALSEASIEAGGQQAPPSIWLFVPPAPGENLTAPLVALEHAVRSRTLAHAGGPALLAVEGEPGAGKSTLLQELAWRCQLAGVEVMRSEFRSKDPRAYGPWMDLLAQVAGVVGIPHPLEGPRSGDVDRYSIYQQIREYLSRAAEKVPLLLMMDNAEQADEESRAALRFISHTLDARDAVLVVVAYRPDEKLHSDLGSPARTQLDPLSAADARRMVADVSGRQDEELSLRIHTHTGGNPLFMMEVLRRLGEAGWPANPDLQQLAPPDPLEDMVAKRLLALEATEQSVVETLAVLGRPATGQLLMEVIQAANGEREAQVGLPLERLEALDWLDRNPDGAFTFRQGPVARILYDQLEPAKKQRLHLAATQVLDRREPKDPVEWTRHAALAGRLDLAMQNLDEAIAILKGLGAHRTVIQLLKDVVALLKDDPPRQQRMRHELGQMYYTVGDYEQAIDQLELASQRADARELASSRIALAKVYRLAGEAEKSLQILEQVLESDPSFADRISAISEETAAQIALDNHVQVLDIVQGALKALEARERSDPVLLAELRGQMAWSLGYLQRYREAAEQFQVALANARASGDRRVEANILNSWAVIAFRQADFTQVASQYGAALECARITGDVERVAVIQFNLAVFHLQRGEYAACLKHLPESVRLFQAMGAQKNLASARCNLGYLELKLGLYEQARATLDKAILETRQVGRRSGEALAVLLMALVNARRSRHAEAVHGIQEARRLYAEVGQLRDAADALLDLAEIQLVAGNHDLALSALRQAGQELDLDQLLDLKLRASALRARIIAHCGTEQQRREQTVELDHASAQAQVLDAPELSWEYHAAAMELADGTGQPDRAIQHAVEAANILESMAADLPADVRAAFWQDSRRRLIRDRAAPYQRQSLARQTSAGANMTVRDRTPFSGYSDMVDDKTLPVLSDSNLPASQTSATMVEERFYRLLEIYRQINSELDPERLLGIVMDTAVELTGAERGFLLLGDSPKTLKVEVARNLDPTQETGAYSRSIAEQVFTTGEPVITVSARTDPRFKEHLSVHKMQLESVLCIPIHARDRTAGILYMESRFQSGRFTPKDQRLLMAFGDQVAIALNNARLLADNIRKAKELQRAKQEIETLAEERGRLLEQRTEQLEEAQKDLAATRRQLETQTGMFGMVGRSPAMSKLFDLVERVAATDVPVLVEGESGTGKEMVARAIHQTSQRKKGRLISVNCAAIPENLLESELFGHVRGAFTGADRERKGLFQSAHGGTLFLDEIGDMPMRMQVDLLRALQEKIIRPVGSQHEIKVDVRVIAASNKPLLALVQAKAFREDLYYRLNVVTLKIPPLRQRTEDIPLLVDHFLSLICAQVKSDRKRITRRALHHLMEYGWPGNVRQLEHALMNATVLADTAVLDIEDFTLEDLSAVPPAPPSPAAAPRAPAPPVDTGIDRKARERQQIIEALEASNWNKSKAAQLLGIPRRTFYRRLMEHDIR